ncbi:hypothetical protein GE09DRAFT_521944 [Coniochaeta sp. 2T2.1]|nr:hypothetical protein GE09DRAFT_521944 [Coniochaeta sp. 2T2.1]
MSGSALFGCPPEIGDQILELLDSRALYALCLVNRSFYSRAQPFLYSEIEWQWTFTWADENREPLLSHEPPIVAFLRTLLDRPDLAALVTKLVLRSSSHRPLWHDQTQKPHPLTLGLAEGNDLPRYVEVVETSQSSGGRPR